MGAIASQITLRLFTQPLIQARIKENIKAPRHWHKWPVTRKMFPFDEVIMGFVHNMSKRLFRPVKWLLTRM